MLSKEDNALLTRVEGDAPMGRMLRDWFWMPAIRAARLKPNDAPTRLRLFGENFVVFRAEDGRVGFMDEGCPHRGVSLALARNENNTLTCIFHGWKFDLSGKLLEVPNEAVHPEQFAARVPVKAYPTREAGGLVWVYLGSNDTPPRFTDLEFTGFEAENMVLGSCTIDCNWVQGLDAALDSAHVALLHQSYVGRMAGTLSLTARAPPSYEIERTPYGLRAAAIRALPDGQRLVRITTFVMPFYGLTASNSYEDKNRTAIIAVPIDDTHTRQWYVRFNSSGGPCDRGFAVGMLDYDVDNFAPIRGSADQHWGQNRAAMHNGHFSGFAGNHFVEDTTVQVSMGAIVDRNKEFLTSSDLAIVQVRRTLLAAVRGYLEGKPPLGTGPDAALGEIQSRSKVLEEGEDWRAAV